MQISPLYTSGERLEALVMKKTAPQNRSEEDIAILCPDISESTIERTLKDLLELGFVEKVGKGRATGYVKKT